MYPILIEVGPFVLSSWHALYLLGSFAAWLYLHTNRQWIFSELSPHQVDLTFGVGYVSGYFGARLFSILIEEEFTQPGFRWLQAIFDLGSMTLYGGVLCAVTALVLYALWCRLSILGLADLCLPATLLAVGFGRIGCFLNGDDYGLPLSLRSQMNPPWWAMRIEGLQDGLYRYPVQLFESIFCWGIVGVLFLFGRKKSFPRGRSADVCVFAYTLGRFSLEFMRGDDRGILFSPFLSPAQWVSLGLIFIWTSFRCLGGRESGNSPSS